MVLTPAYTVSPSSAVLSPAKIDQCGYNVDSRILTAEPMWNGFTEAGYKTLVMHWPGGAWPPTNDSENLFVIDGSAPGSVGSAAMQCDTEQLIGASVDIPEATFIVRDLVNAVAPCVINKLPDQELEASDTAKGMQMMTGLDAEKTSQLQDMGIETINIIYKDEQGFGTRVGDFQQNMSTAISRLKRLTAGLPLRQTLKSSPCYSAKA